MTSQHHTHSPGCLGKAQPISKKLQVWKKTTGSENLRFPPTWRFKKKTPVRGIHPATGEATLSCVFVDLDDKTGLAKSIKQIIKGGSLEEIS